MEELITKWVLKNAVDYEGTASAKAVVPKVIGEKPELKKDIKSLMKKINEKIKELNKLSVEEQTKRLEKIAPELLEEREEQKRELPELENAKQGATVMRMAPFPSGPLHIGNARMAILNDEYTKRYGGKLFLMFDDTVGTQKTEIKKGEQKTKLRLKEIDPAAYKLIPEGLKWLGINYDKEYYKSDRVEIYQKYCKELIEKEAAYICTCSGDDFRNKYKNERKACPHRKQSVKENLAEWEKMFTEYEQGDAVVRLKTNVEHPNPALREPAIMRISEKEHPRVKDKYRVWPLMEFSWAVDDHLLGMTHILRGKDLLKEDYIEQRIWDYLGWGSAEFIHYGYISLMHGALSKSKIAALIKKGEINDWYDPRTWSLQSLKVRGIKPEAVREFILSFGLSQSDITADVDILYSKNRELIEPTADRYFFVRDPIELTVRNIPESYVAEIQKHPDYKERGVKKYKVEKGEMKFYVERSDFVDKKQGDKFRLMDLMNIELEIDAEDKVLASFEGKNYKKGSKVIHWVNQKQAVSGNVLMVDGTVENGYIEKEAIDLEIGNVIQFIRFGYARLDKKEKEMLFRYSHN